MGRKRKQPGRLASGFGTVWLPVSGVLRPVLLKGVLAVSVLAVLFAGLWGLETYFRRMERYQVYAETLTLERLPAWVTPGIRGELSELTGIPSVFSIRERGICRKIAASYESIPWVENVISVKKIYPSRIVAELNLRRPIVGVRAGRLHYLTDARGYRLSRALKTWPPDGFDLPLVVTRTVEFVPERGEQWSAFGVLSGVAVQTYLMRAPLQTRIKIIDLTNLGGRTDPRQSEVVLWTERDTRIDWGRSPLRTDSPGELAPLHKIAKMIDFERRSGPLDLFGSVKIHYDGIYVDNRPRPVAVRHTDG